MLVLLIRVCDYFIQFRVFCLVWIGGLDGIDFGFVWDEKCVYKVCFENFFLVSYVRYFYIKDFGVGVRLALGLQCGFDLDRFLQGNGKLADEVGQQERYGGVLRRGIVFSCFFMVSVFSLCLVLWSLVWFYIFQNVV